MKPRWLRRLVTGRRWPSLERQLTVVRDLDSLKQAMGWSGDPLLTDPHLAEYRYPEDANHRRLRDAEVVGTACLNAGAGSILEIGTSHGHMTAVMARNAPTAIVHTINIPPEESSQGGRLITHAPSRDEIGSYYREAGLVNVRQIFANTATWQPDLADLRVVFIDGCHDYEFVINDTMKALSRCSPGSVILWHDFAPDLAYRFPWIGQVVDAVDMLFQRRILSGPVFQLRDSWVGAYRVP